MNSNNDYYQMTEGDQQHAMQQGQRYGGGNRGGHFGRQPPSAGNMPRQQQHPHQNQHGQAQQHQHQQQQQGGQQNVVLRQQHVSQQMQQQQPSPYVLQPPYVFYPQPGQIFRYQAPSSFSPYTSQQMQFSQHQIYNQQAAYAALIASGNVLYQTQPAPQNPPQTHQHHSITQYYMQPQTQIQGHYNVRGQTTVGQPQIQPPVQAQPSHQVHQLPQPPAVVAPPVVSGIVAPGPIPQPTEREVPRIRQKKFLKIVDPNTGKTVIEGDIDRPPSTSPLPTVETVELIGDNEYCGIMECGSHEIPYGSYVRTEHEAKQILKIAIPSDEPRGKTPEESCIDPTVNKAKSDFFQYITAAADEGRGRSNSTPEAVVHPPQARVSSPIPSSSPTFMALTAPIFEPLGTTDPSVVHISFLQPDIAVDEPLVIEPVISSLLPEIEEQPPSQTLLPNLGLPDTADNYIAELPSPKIEPVITNIETITTIEVEIPEPPSTPPHAGGGRGDEFLNISTVSISPDPIEKYIEVTPEKPPSTLNTESGEPSPVGNSTRESTVSPSFPMKVDDSLPSSTPNQLTDEEEEKDEPEVENGVAEDEEEEEDEDEEEVMEVTKGVEEITLMSIEPAQHEPNFQNGENDLEEGSADEGVELEEGELLEDADGGEEDESNEPAQKRRIVYDRSTLLNFKTATNKDALQGIDSIPPELIRDGKSPANNIAPLPRTPGGTFGTYGNSRNTSMGKMNNNNRQGAYPNRSMQMPAGQWGGMGAGGMFQIPPPLPNRIAPPVTLQLKPVELHKAENAWKPSLPSKRGEKNVDETKDEEQLLIDDIVKKTRGILNKLTPENFEKLVQKFLTLKFEDKDERIGAVISVVFEKAIDEPSFSTAYAKMVHRVWQSSAVTSNIFRKKILDQCQKEFQQGNTAEEALKLLEIKLAEAPADKKDLIMAEMEDKKTIARRRSLGNVRFIGELYKLGMLTPKIMVECVSRLLNSRDEESYECLCKLLTTIGQMLDVQLHDITRRVAPPKWIPEPKYMESTFLTLKSLSNDASLSSRIRFALLDVWELRDMGWKPRRDANAPKTIEEVRRAAIREEQEEKKQLMNLPPAQVQPSSRGGPMIQPKKPSDWNTVPSNKSSRFSQTKKQPTSELSGDGLVKFAPQGGGWARSGNGSTGFGGVSKNLPPRFSRHPDLAEGPAPTPSREDIVQELPPVRTPSSQSSRESSRPQTPTKESVVLTPRSQAPAAIELPSNSIEEFDVPETVKNIFSEFMDQKTLDYEWLNNRFPGKRVLEFVDELSRQVCDMSKEDQQKTAGGLIKNLIKKEHVTKAQVIKSLQEGVIPEMPDIEVDVPKVTSYLAMFLVELFVDEDDFSWLLDLGEPLRDDFTDSWTNLVINTLNILKLRRSEEVVQGLYKKTHQGSYQLPVQNIPWVIGETLESITSKMKTVLQGATGENLVALCRENSWDLREGLTLQGLAETICTLCWPGTGEWDLTLLDRWFQQIKLPPNPKLYPLLWQQAKDFMKRNSIGSEQEDVIWRVLNRHDLLVKDKAK